MNRLYIHSLAKECSKSEKEEKRGAEKPISLWGAPFTEAVAALLKTKPMPKAKSKKSATKNS